MATLRDWWNGVNCTLVFAASTAMPAGRDYHLELGEEDESYCDLHDLLDSGLSPKDLWELEGEVDNGDLRWTWNGEGKAWDYRGNNYTKIVCVGWPEKGGE